MALRDQPYLPLYVKDFSADTKLRRCSSSSIGVYIMLMCALHSEKEYGCLVLKQTEKLSPDQMMNFATTMTKLLPFDAQAIYEALTELTLFEVLTIDGDKIQQKRMVKDGKLSEKRKEAGKKGGKSTQAKAKQKRQEQKQPDQPDDEANTEANIDEETEAKKSELISKMVDHFKYTAPHHNKQRSKIRDFVNSLPHKEKLDILSVEFESFKQLMSKRESKYQVQLNSFVGNQNVAWDDGKWDDNWTEQLNNYNNTSNNGRTTTQGGTGTRSNLNPAGKRSFGKL